MVSLRCFWMRRRLPAMLGGALSGQPAAALAAHLERCQGCRQEVGRLERLRELVRATLPAAPEPDWSGFWDGVRRRILAESPRPWAEPWWAGLWREAGGHRRWALGGALAGLLLVSLALWPREPREPPVVVHPPTVVVNSLETARPEGNLVVFTNPEDEMTVIWVFGLDQPGEESWIRPVGFSPAS